MTQEILQKCTVDGTIVKLPDFQIDRKEYLKVKKALELIGGKWKGGKVFGFVFQEDPTNLLNKIANGTNLNLKKEFQMFFTPNSLADRLVKLTNIKENDLILEPSAGQGAIINAIRRILPNTPVDWCEINNINQDFCKKIPNTNFVKSDFLWFNEMNKYDKIIANPPFSKNQDIEHVYNMYSCLKQGGRMVSVMSEHWQNLSGKKEKNFSKWLYSKKSEMYHIEAGTFKESRTMVSAVIIAIDKE